MNAYVLAGWIIAMGGTVFYVVWTLLTEGRIAAQVLALEDSVATPQTSSTGLTDSTGGEPS
jgi:hypothetical protein